MTHVQVLCMLHLSIRKLHNATTSDENPASTLRLSVSPATDRMYSASLGNVLRVAPGLLGWSGTATLNLRLCEFVKPRACSRRQETQKNGVNRRVCTNCKPP